MVRNPTQPFKRWEPHGGTTIAYRLFRHDMIELNNFCWNGQGAVNHVLRTISHKPPDDQVKNYVSYGKDPGRRSDTLVRDAHIAFKEVDNWIRLATVVYTASLLELFIRRIVSLALSSDPGLVIFKSQAVDGVELLKGGNGEDLHDRIKACTEGAWSSREQGLQRVFGVQLAAVFDNIGELQQVQNLRNSIAHDFARTAKAKDFWYLDPALAQLQPINRISGDRLQNILRIVSKVASEIERHAVGHIGSFELFQFWHNFLGKHRRKEKIVEQYLKYYKEGGTAKLLSRYHYFMTSRPLGREYCRGLIHHYDSFRSPVRT